MEQTASLAALTTWHCNSSSHNFKYIKDEGLYSWPKLHHVYSSPLWNAHSQTGEKTMWTEMIWAILKYASCFYQNCIFQLPGTIFKNRDFANSKPLSKDKLMSSWKCFWLYLNLKTAGVKTTARHYSLQTEVTQVYTIFISPLYYSSTPFTLWYRKQLHRTSWM